MEHQEAPLGLCTALPEIREVAFGGRRGRWLPSPRTAHNRGALGSDETMHFEPPSNIVGPATQGRGALGVHSAAHGAAVGPPPGSGHVRPQPWRGPATTCRRNTTPLPGGSGACGHARWRVWPPPPFTAQRQVAFRATSSTNNWGFAASGWRGGRHSTDTHTHTHTQQPQGHTCLPDGLVCIGPWADALPGLTPVTSPYGQALGLRAGPPQPGWQPFWDARRHPPPRRPSPL